jgi:hypothetical protein
MSECLQTNLSNFSHIGIACQLLTDQPIHFLTDGWSLSNVTASLHTVHEASNFSFMCSADKYNLQANYKFIEYVFWVD